MQKETEINYSITLITKENNIMNVLIIEKKSKLFIAAAFNKNYFRKTFVNFYTLEQLKESSSYFKQFNNVNEIINEINNNKLKGEEKIEGNEETSNVIKLEIPLPGTQFSKISFELKLANKTPIEIFNEYKKIINLYESKFLISNFNSKILAGKDLEKETIKMWITPIPNIEAKLLFYFHDIKYKDDKSKYPYILNQNVRKFHKACDYKYSILVICKSKNEIFGGYTPLCFNSSDEYGKDNDSFLFSLNKLQKYPKDSYNNTESLWCYKNYGPCFHWDLYFREKKIYAVKFEKKNYLTPEKWINKDNCYVNEEGILLDSLEIFQIASASYFKNNDNSTKNNKNNNKIENIKKDKEDEHELEKECNQIIQDKDCNNINDDKKNQKENNMENKENKIE